MNLAVFAAIFLWLALPASAQNPVLTPDVSRALASISGDSLAGNLSFLASGLLEGRDTPSRGLDLAAEYIAAQFRKSSLRPAGDDGFLQTAHLLRAVPPGEGFLFRLTDGKRTVDLSSAQVGVVSRQPLEISGGAVQKTGQTYAVQGAGLNPIAYLQVEDPQDRPLLRRLVDPDEEQALYRDVPRFILHDVDAARMLNDARAGDTGITLSVKLPAATTEPVTVRNVAGILRGSDPVLRDQFILLTAHYDHLGSENGKVYPGANDDASGTVSVIEIAQALARLRVHPKRSILFMAFFGEEEGSLGARYYIRHPLVPIAKTVADLNLEQLGRTDSKEGQEIADASLTGFRYSDVPRVLQAAGAQTGIRVYETLNGDEYYTRSDNLPFAEHGIPAHTLVVAFEFPDYHEPTDTWQKIDYANMAKVDRMIALGLVMLADRPESPSWNKENPNTVPYRRPAARSAP